MTSDIINRIKQQIPPCLSVTPRTTPVVYFGDFDKASACTISINPSHSEFYSNTAILTGEKKRLISRQELNRLDSEELSLADAEQVLDYCKNYFRVNPYKAWFNKYDEFLKVFGYSYYDDSVVHLDLTQWATTPLWSGLSEDKRMALLKLDLPFLNTLLQKKFNVIFLNGRTVVNAVQQHLGLQLTNHKASFDTYGKKRSTNFTIYHGHYNDSEIIGWSSYLQSIVIPGYEDARKFAATIKSELNSHKRQSGIKKMPVSHSIQRIVSGGQTGIDQLGLEVAKALGIPTGGMAPKGYLTESGPDSILRYFGLTEHESAEYPPRTRANIIGSDGTVVFGKLTGGTKLTVASCEKEKKPYLTNPTVGQLHVWLIEKNIKTLNVAGSRASKLKPGEIDQYRTVLTEALGAGERMAVLFDRRPYSLGLRGDPFLWDEMAVRAKSFVLPATGSQFHNLMKLMFKESTGEALVPGLELRIPRFESEGMSSGGVSADYWIDTAIPFMEEQLAVLRGWPTTNF